jgi:O-antigen/teichoic acid export membrane protein
MVIASRTYSQMKIVRAFTKPHVVLIGNAASLFNGAVASSVLGFAYWWTAARFFSLEAVGLTAAAISIMGLIALVAQSGISTVLIGEPLDGSEEKIGLITAALTASLATGVLLGFLLLIVSSALSLKIGSITGSYAGGFCFVLGCGATSFAAVLNATFLGLLRSPLQMYHNIAFSVAKLALLIPLAAWSGTNSGEAILFGSWVASQVGASVAFAGLGKVKGWKFVKPRFSALRPFASVIFSHHVLDLILLAPTLIMPFVVAVTLTPATNAAFNIAWVILRTTFQLPAALSTVLFALGCADCKAFTARLRFSLTVTSAGGLCVVCFFGLFSDHVLRIFGNEYSDIAADSLRVLGLSFLGASVRSFYLTIERLNGRMLHASYFFALASVAELLLSFIGAQFFGLFGLATGWVVAMTLQAIFLFGTVLRAAYPRNESVAHNVT